MSPDHYGPLRDLFYTGEYFIAVGMGRQIYKLDPELGWSYFHEGIRFPEGPGEVCGFNSICLDSEGTLYAVGTQPDRTN